MCELKRMKCYFLLESPTLKDELMVNACIIIKNMIKMQNMDSIGIRHGLHFRYVVMMER